MKAIYFWAAFMLAASLASSSGATPIASDSFSTEGGFFISYTPGSIADEAPIEGCIGFMGGWSGGTAAFVVTNGGLTHPLTPGKTWDGRLIAYTSSGSAGGGGARNLGRLLTSAPGSGTYYMSVLLQKNAFTSSRDLLAGLSAENPPETGIFDVYGSYIGFLDGGISFFAPGAQIWQLLPYAQVNVNETYFALLRYDYSTSGPDTVTATIYNGASSQVAQQTMTGLGLDGSLTDFGVLTQDFGPMVAIDEWRFGTALSDVMAPLPLAGDYSGNGIVDAADFTVWRDSLGRTGSGLAADGNRNNVIDAGDYDVWKTNFGNHAGSGAGNLASAIPDAGVPEPATIALALIAAALLYARPRAANKSNC
jgi:hypothetical protein